MPYEYAILIILICTCQSHFCLNLIEYSGLICIIIINIIIIKKYGNISEHLQWMSMISYFSNYILSNVAPSNKSKKKIKHYYPLLFGSNIFYAVVSVKQDE